MAQPSYKTILSYFWLQARKHRGYLFLVLATYGIGSLLADITMPILVRRIIDIVSSYDNKFIAWLVLKETLIIMGLIMIGYNIAHRVGDFAVAKFESKTMKDMADYAFSKLTNHSYKFFSNSFSGSLVTKVKRFVRALEDISDQVFFVFWITIVQLVGVLVSLFIFAHNLAWLFVAWIIVYFFFSYYLTKKKIPYDLEQSTSDSRVTARLADVITNILNLKMFSSRKQEIQGFVKITGKEEIAKYNAWSFSNKINLIQGVFFTILEFAGMAFALYLWKEGTISAGTIVLFQYFIAVMAHNLWNLGKAMGKMSKSFADASELVEIFETPLDILDPIKPEQLKVGKGSIELKNIGFSYGKNSEEVFEDFSLKIPAGQRIGLVGHSGAGKSTITKLLLRFADIQKGSIKIDDQDITLIAQDDLRSKIAYVPQDPILFHRTLRENIAYAKPDATEKKIIEVAKKAHANEFIKNFPEGYKTLVGERGVKLSGGERQRVAIARAMLKNAPILILDEATSSLDAISEKYIQEAFEELMKGKTTIVIAHRLSTIQRLDRIVVLEGGKIVEDGNHSELISKKGLYYNFWEHQTAGFIE